MVAAGAKTRRRNCLMLIHEYLSSSRAPVHLFFGRKPADLTLIGVFLVIVPGEIRSRRALLRLPERLSGLESRKSNDYLPKKIRRADRPVLASRNSNSGILSVISCSIVVERFRLLAQAGGGASRKNWKGTFRK